MGNEDKIYFAFYTTKKEWLYFNELKKHTNLSNSSLQNALKNLYSSKEILKNKEISNIFYKLANNEKKMLKFAGFDIEKLNSLNTNVKIPVKEFLEKIGKIKFVIMFGSASQGMEKKGSDIDLLIVTHYFDNKKLNDLYQKEIKKESGYITRKVNAKSLYLLSPVFVNENEFRERKDYLLDEAKKTGFCIYNHEIYYGDILKNEN